MNIKTKLALGLAFIAAMFIAMLASPNFMLNNVSILIGVLLGVAYVPQIVEILLSIKLGLGSMETIEMAFNLNRTTSSIRSKIENMGLK